MQYADSIDEWAEIMVKNNSGAYANSWLLGDIRTGEIARLELGLKQLPEDDMSVQRVRLEHDIAWLEGWEPGLWEDSFLRCQQAANIAEEMGYRRLRPGEDLHDVCVADESDFLPGVFELSDDNLVYPGYVDQSLLKSLDSYLRRLYDHLVGDGRIDGMCHFLDYRVWVFFVTRQPVT